MPSLFEVLALNEDGYEHLPEPEVPYYVHAKEGDYLYKPTQIGNALIKTEWAEIQKHIGRIGFAGGVFVWKGEKIPATVISQAHDFFRRIFTAKRAEAEVLITKHNETGAFRLFVPYQRVSHGGVKSIYEPTHVDRQYTVVGTLHSHCDFTAFHSGTDSDDASDMDGVHLTIGHVDDNAPQVVAMVAMNGKEFHYTDPKDVAEIEFGKATAPAWWDQYVFANGEAPTTKPVGLISLTQAHWDEFLGRELFKPKHSKVYTPTTWTPPVNKGWKKGWSSIGDGTEYDWRRTVYGAGRPSDMPTYEGEITNPVIDTALEFAEKAGIFTDYDWESIKASDMDDDNFWKGFFINRLNAAVETLEIFGIEFEFKRKKVKA